LVLTFNAVVLSLQKQEVVPSWEVVGLRRVHRIRRGKKGWVYLMLRKILLCNCCDEEKGRDEFILRNGASEILS